MKVVIIDDERLAIKLLSGFVEKIPNVELVLATTNAFEAIELLSTKAVDLLFLDIEMPDINGLEFLQSLSHPPATILTTAFEKYAVQGFDLDVIDYLVKPIRFERFLKGINKAKEITSLRKVEKEVENNHIFIKVNYQTRKLEFDQILYIEGLKDYVKIYTLEGMVLTRLNLKGIMAKLPNTHFVRIHRSFIVSIAKITAFQKANISIGETKLPIGETYLTELEDRIHHS